MGGLQPCKGCHQPRHLDRGEQLAGGLVARLGSPALAQNIGFHSVLDQRVGVQRCDRVAALEPGILQRLEQQLADRGERGDFFCAGLTLDGVEHTADAQRDEQQPGDADDEPKDRPDRKLRQTPHRYPPPVAAPLDRSPPAIRGMTLIESGLMRHKPRSRLRVYLTRIRIFPTSGEARGSPRATPRGRQGRRRRALGPAFGDSLIVVPRYTAHYWLGERVVKGSRSYGVGPERLLTGASTVRRVLE